jgi:hypothetical protein
VSRFADVPIVPAGTHLCEGGCGRRTASVKCTDCCTAPGDQVPQHAVEQLARERYGELFDLARGMDRGFMLTTARRDLTP